MASIVARNYADALYELATENNCLEVILEELNSISDFLSENDELYKAMIHPSIEKDDKKNLFFKVFENTNKLISNTVKLLIDKNHFKLILEIRKAFNKKYREAKGIEIANIYSAKPLSDEAVNKITTLLEKRTGKKIEVKLFVDESLIAGVRIKLNDEIIDNTLINQILRLKEKVDTEII